MNKDHLNELDRRAPITEQASHWWILLSGESATQADRQAFLGWVARSPERVEAFLQTARLTKALQSKKLKWPDTPAEILVREARETPANIVAIFSPDLAQAQPRDRSRAPRGLRGPPFMFVVAATLLIAIACSWVFLASSQRYATAIGEQRSVVLSDG